MSTYFGGVPFRNKRTRPADNTADDSRRSYLAGRTQLPARNLPHERYPSVGSADTHLRAIDGLKLALITLHSACSNSPYGSSLNRAIEVLLETVDVPTQALIDAPGLFELTSQIDHTTPIVSEFVMNNSKSGRVFVKALREELKSLTKGWSDARQQGRLNQFLSTNNDRSVAKHNRNLVQMIKRASSAADNTPGSINRMGEVTGGTGGTGGYAHIGGKDGESEAFHNSNLVHMMKRTSLSADTAPEPIELGDVTGGMGGTGGDADDIGGEGGEGEGPKLEIDPDLRWKVGNISGGTGGTGGKGVKVGGRGGTGKAPIITVLRRHQVVQRQHVEEEYSIL
ncbi:hypothetical protein C8J57DRAFT_1287960 [Mycena rebaudengoi]|nr:hypothetical protein C8J57DRAFT_1287960 [Mycena rebaudengoi]